jgi:hypothetical protein
MTAPAPKPKRAWPLLLLPALGFVPLFGVFLGAGALTWGLLSDRPRAKLAAILGASGALLNILGVMLLAVLYQHAPETNRAQAMLARRDLGQLVVELEHYRAQHSHYPANLQLLVGVPVPHVFVNTLDRTAGLLRLQYYQYHVAPDGDSYDLFAVGPDGIPGTADDVRPELPDSVRRHSGYRPTP